MVIYKCYKQIYEIHVLSFPDIYLQILVTASNKFGHLGGLMGRALAPSGVGGLNLRSGLVKD